jgi:flagellar motor component MotA
MLEEMQKKNEQMMEQKEKSYQEHLRQLTERMNTERAQLMAEQEKTLALKLQVFNCTMLRLLFSVFSPFFITKTWCGKAEHESLKSTFLAAF